MLRSKKPFLFQPGLQLLQSQLRFPQPVREHGVDVYLKRTVPLIEGDAAAHHDPHPLFRAECEPPGIRPEHDRLHTAGFVPQGKVTVPAAGILNKVGDLAAQSQIKQGVVHVQPLLDIAVELGDRDHVSHNPASRAARMDTPMALSLEYCPGTK